MVKTMNATLTVETEFDLMVRYQISIESKSTLVEHSMLDMDSHGLYKIVEPFPTYEQYLQGNDFTEGELIESSSNIVQLELLQESLRQQKTPRISPEGF